MKTQFITIFLLVLMATPEVFAQNRRRGNANGNGNTARQGNARNGGATRQTTRPNRQTTRPTPTQVNRRVQDRRRRPVNNRPVTRPAPRVNRNTPYRGYRHTPVRRVFAHRRRYARPFNYYSYINANYNTYIYVNWLLFPSTRINGYYQGSDYPYYVYDGYQHRYSDYDTCNYQLVDKFNHNVIQTYWNQTCSTGYNSCAYQRDAMNSREYDTRYFCAETFQEENYSTYNDDYYDQTY